MVGSCKHRKGWQAAMWRHWLSTHLAYPKTTPKSVSCPCEGRQNPWRKHGKWTPDGIAGSQPVFNCPELRACSDRYFMYEATALQECCDIVDNRLYPLRCVKEATVCKDCEIWKEAQDMIAQWCIQEFYQLDE